MLAINYPCTICCRPRSISCSHCQSVWYCTPKHLHEDWPRHQKECIPARASAGDSSGLDMGAPPSAEPQLSPIPQFQSHFPEAYRPQSTILDPRAQLQAMLWTQHHSPAGNVLHPACAFHGSMTYTASRYPLSSEAPHVDPYGLWSSSNDVAPPLHTRPLYDMTPLPGVDVTSLSSSCGTGPTPSLLDEAPPPVQLHPFLQSAYLLPRQTSNEAYRPVTNLPSMSWALIRHEPAMWPSVGSLSILIHSTGETISVRPSTPQSPFIVSVEDVLCELGNAFVIASDCICHGPSWSCECARLSVLTNSLGLWWSVNERAPESCRPWQLVVGRR